MRIHKKEKPFKCTMCDKSFYTKGNMRDHEKRHSKQKYLHHSLTYIDPLNAQPMDAPRDIIENMS